MKSPSYDTPVSPSFLHLFALILFQYLVSLSSAFGDIAFQETFTNDSGINQGVGYLAAPWIGYKGIDASTSVTNAVYLPCGEGNPAGTPGLLGINAQQGNGATQYAAVTTFAPIENVDCITWTMGNISDAQQVHVLVQSGGNWYVSSESFTSSGFYSSDFPAARTDLVTYMLNFTTDDSAWNAFTLDPNVSMVVGTAAALPEAAITGIGFYVETANTTIVRLDTLAVHVAHPPAYKQYFDNTSGVNKNVGYLQDSWTAYMDSNASTVVTNAIFLSAGDGNPVGTPGLLGVNAQQGNGATQYVAVTTFDAIGNVDCITWTMGNISDAQQVHVLVQSGGNWYVSAESFTSSEFYGTDFSDAETDDVTYLLNFTTDDSAWNAFTLDPNVSMAVGTAASLPEEAITGVGFYVETANTTFVRLDTLAVHVAPPRTTEQLPMDRFDEYQEGTLPPHPWHVYALSASVEMQLEKASESPFPNNKYPGTGDDIYTGKGLVMTDTDSAAGGNAGCYRQFAPPPHGKVYLGYDFRLGDVNGTNTGQPFYTDLSDLEGRGLSIRHDISTGLCVLNANGTETVLYTGLVAGRWYHLGATVSPDGTADFALYSETAKKTRIGLGSVSLPPYSAFRQLSFLNAPEDTNIGVWVVDNICTGGDVNGSRDTLLPFEPLPTATLRASSHKVYGYYYPIYTGFSTDAEIGLGWSVLTLLNPEEVFDDPARIDAGTELLYCALQRPAIDASITDSTARMVTGMEDQVRLGIEMGLDGFFADFSISSNYAAFNARSLALVQAAENVGAGFKIVPAIYSTGRSSITGEGDLDTTPEEYAACPLFDQLDASPAVLHTDDGKMVFSMWLSERHSVAWWEEVFDLLEARGIDTVFIPHFNSTTNLAAFSPISYGMAHWGQRIPVDNGWIALASQYTDQVVAPIASHDVRTRGTSYFESKNFDTIRMTWECAIKDGAEWAILNTWSDYTEQAMAPSTSIGYALYDLNTYYTQWFKTGTAPTITRDVLYYSYRIHHTEIDPGLGVEWTLNLPWLSTPSNEIELLAFLKDAGTIRVIVAGQTYEQTAAAAGIYSLRAPLPADTAFVPEFILERNGETLIDELGQYPVLDIVEYPNFLYHSGVLPARD